MFQVLGANLHPTPGPAPLRGGELIKKLRFMRSNDLTNLNFLIINYQMGNLNVQAVTHAAHCFQETGMARVYFNRVAQPADVDIECARVFGVFGFPHQFEKELPLHHLTVVFHQEAQKTHLARGEAHLLAKAPHLFMLEI